LRENAIFKLLVFSPKDFWGRRWNMVVRTLFRKQLYADKAEKLMKNGEHKQAIMALKRLRAFVISGFMHEAIMILVNRNITLEQLSFFLINGLAVYLQCVIPIPQSVVGRIPRVLSITLTMIFLASTCKLFLGPFLRFDDQCILFGKHSFI
jgi:hypothetical protein